MRETSVDATAEGYNSNRSDTCSVLLMSKSVNGSYSNGSEDVPNGATSGSESGFEFAGHGFGAALEAG